MAVQIQKMSVEQFDEWALRPENSERDYEYIAGEIVDVVSNQYSSKIAFELGFYIRLFLREKGLEGDVTGADGGYIVMGGRYIPDVGFISRARQPQPSREAYNPNAPDLAVEVLSPADPQRLLTIKIANYLLAGTVVWVVYPEEKEIHVYIPGQPPEVLGEDDTLDGGAVLPGFSLPVRDIFKVS